MMNHPVTPMREADLLRHLAAQTALRSALVDLLALEGDAGAGLVRALADEDVAIVLFDTISPAHLRTIGKLIDDLATPAWFTVGSSAVGTALAGEGASPSWSSPGEVDALLVVSGSCSPVTAEQIGWSARHGFDVIEVEPQPNAIFAATDAAATAIRAGRSVVVCTARGATDTLVPACELGPALGRLAHAVVEATGIRRVMIAGGDTSSYAGRALGVESLTMLAPLAPGAPLCRAHGARLPIQNLEVNFKGGQVGAPDYFGAVRRGQL
jgi:uncharacterized protein YgbK (DUF1537 family)